MSGCCDEPGCRRRQPIRLSRAGLTGRWYFVMRWKNTGRGLIVAIEKHYVGDDVQAQLEELTAAEPSVPVAQLRAVIALIGDEDMTPTARRMLESVCGEQVSR